MGWSEKYWDDVKSDLEQLATEAEPAEDDQARDQPAQSTLRNAASTDSSNCPELHQS